MMTLVDARHVPVGIPDPDEDIVHQQEEHPLGVAENHM